MITLQRARELMTQALKEIEAQKALEEERKKNDMISAALKRIEELIESAAEKGLHNTDYRFSYDESVRTEVTNSVGENGFTCHLYGVEDTYLLQIGWA